jgi:hypothetical protein
MTRSERWVPVPEVDTRPHRGPATLADCLLALDALPRGRRNSARRRAVVAATVRHPDTTEATLLRCIAVSPRDTNVLLDILQHPLATDIVWLALIAGRRPLLNPALMPHARPAMQSLAVQHRLLVVAAHHTGDVQAVGYLYREILTVAAGGVLADAIAAAARVAQPVLNAWAATASPEALASLPQGAQAACLASPSHALRVSMIAALASSSMGGSRRSRHCA